MGLALALVAGELLDALVLCALFGFDLLLVGLPGWRDFMRQGWDVYMGCKDLSS